MSQSRTISTCPDCFQPITDNYWIIFANAKYHAGCFTCHSCERAIGPKEQIRHHLGKRTCHDCAVKQDPSLAEERVCFGCEEEISSAWLNALGHKWHKDCFKCDQCSEVINPANKFHKVEVGGKTRPRCKKCQLQNDMKRLDMSEMKCKLCEVDIDGNYLKALGSIWHHDCFKCSQCHEKIKEKSFHENKGYPLCGGCYKRDFQTKCVRCGQGVAGKALVYKQDNFHYSCLQCTTCGSNLTEGDHSNLVIVNGKDFKHKTCPQ